MVIDDIKVSVIIPTYKRSDYLIRAIESVLSQTHNNIEIIVVDDNDPKSEFRKSTEEKMEIFALDNRVRYFKNQKNMGGGKTRNVGIKKCRGEYITFLDDDDIYLKDKVKVQLEYMLKNNLDVTFTDLRLHNMENKLVDYREFNFIKSFKNDSLLKYHLTRHITGTPTFMFKSNILNKINGFRDVNMAQEFYLMLDAIESKAKIGYLNEANVIAYLHDGEKISSGSNKVYGENSLYLSKKYYFEKLSKSEIRYIEFRHKVVLAVAYKRNNQNLKALIELGKATLCHPIFTIKEIALFLNKINKNI